MSAGRLLAIDDEPDFGSLLRRVAERIGFESQITTDAHVFKNLYASFKPTVISLDVVMPDTDGIELVRWLAAQGCTARVVIISGFDPKYAAAAEMLGRIEGKMPIMRLRKPVSMAELETAFAGS